MRNASRRAAAQMERDGIRKLSAWSKPRNVGYAHVQHHIGLPACEHPGCAKHARYATPDGNRCFPHAIARKEMNP
ncbi:hypothetical protein [Sphingomonas sp.]|uniref:hypothetical protein n=1 Tax=Sphingomonas sp. TaxID=28214 RepID=UPI003BA9AD66